MAEEEGTKEDKFDAFTPEGEALGYITLEQARVLAIEHARDNLDFYGSSYSGVNLVWEVVSQEEGEDYYDIRLSFRPAGRYRGEPGVEQFIIDKVGSVRVRQLLDEPSEVAGEEVPPPRRRRRWILWLAIAAGTILVVLFIIGVSIPGDEEGTSSGIIAIPTDTPLPPPTLAGPTPVRERVERSTEIPTPAQKSGDLATSPAIAALDPIEAIPPEELFGMSMLVMNGLDSFRVEATLEERDPETQQVTAVFFSGAKSGKMSQYKMEGTDPGGVRELLFDAIWLPPHNYNIEPSEVKWYQERTNPDDATGDLFFLVSSILIFPSLDIPLDLYQLTGQGIEDVDGHRTRRIRVEVDWLGIVDWLKDEGKLAAVAARLSDETPEEFYISYPKDPPDRLEVWLDESGFMRRLEFDGIQDGKPATGFFRLYDFNLPIEILAPEQFSVRETVADPPTQDLLSAPPEELFSLSKAVMNNLDSFRFDASFDAQDFSLIDLGLSYLEATKSGDAAEYYFEAITTEGIPTGGETIRLPPFMYEWDTDDLAWYRSRVGEAEPPGVGPAVFFSSLAFPHPDIPLDFYELEPLGIEFIDGVRSRYLRVHVDWTDVANWLKTEGKLDQAAARITRDGPESFYDSIRDEYPDPLELWIDEDGFVRKLEIQGGSGGETVASILFYDFNLPIEILAPDQFSVLEGAGADPTPTPQIQNYQGLTFKQYGAPPLMTIDLSASYTATILTNQGPIVLALFVDSAPKTVNNFAFLAAEGFYDGLIFHRVIEQFMIQGGDPTGSGGAGPGYNFEDEIDPDLVFDAPGKLAMANSGPNTNGSQFFITTVPTPHLNGAHTIFGQVLAGQEIAEAISKVPKDQAGRPIQPVIIESIRIGRTGGR